MSYSDECLEQLANWIDHDDVVQEPDEQTDKVARRKALSILSGIGIGSLVFQRALSAQIPSAGEIEASHIAAAEWVAGVELDESDRESLVNEFNAVRATSQVLLEAQVDYAIHPAVHMNVHEDPQQVADLNAKRNGVVVSLPREKLSVDNNDDIGFATITELAAMLRKKQISSSELTRIYLNRLRTYDQQLLCVVNFCEESAMKQAAEADEQLSKGKELGLLHGIPWGAKDLIAYPGYPTTWGAPCFENQEFDYKATVASRLDDAGAVLIAKLSLGALAMGDQWYRGMTRNPWNTEQGSSGSSAGSASATAAGLVGFSLGSETYGSIVSPSRRCGNSGLRPTYGRVSRAGCMPLTWSMDKIGPICRSVADCALVFDAIHGADGEDPTVKDYPFNWSDNMSLKGLRVGLFDGDRRPGEQEAIDILKERGAEFVTIELPADIPVQALVMILFCEAGTVFDDITRDGVTEGLNRWPGLFRRARFTNAADYLKANRIRTQLIHKMRDTMKDIDIYIGSPASELLITNLTGHPTVVMPAGFNEEDGQKTPFSITMTGQLFGESKLLAAAHAFQQETSYHRERPVL